MGAGRKTTTYKRDENASFGPKAVSDNIYHRMLEKSQLGGVIFGCTKSTMGECLSKQLFGLPAQHFSYVRNIDPGLPLFLFNYSDRKMHGIFESASPGRMYIDQYGWTSGGSERTQYPAQVQIRVRLQCRPLLEEHFKAIIADNYYSPKHFMFELDHAQARQLMSLFSPLEVAPNQFLPQKNTIQRDVFRLLPSNVIRKEGEELKRPEFENSSQSSRNSDSLDTLGPFVLENNPLEEQMNSKELQQDEINTVYMKLQEISLRHEPQTFSYVDDSIVINETCVGEKGFLEEQLNVDKKAEESLHYSSDCQPTICQMILAMEELKVFKEEQTLKMCYLEHKLAEAENEIQWLKNRCMMLENGPNLSAERVKDMTVEYVDWKDLDYTESVYLVGGYDGQSWLSTLNSYFPMQDVVKHLSQMSSTRSYASAAQLGGNLYVFGGGDGNSWYDTAESYNPASNTWTLCPSLNERKGSLAGAAVHDKIFAIGGGNGVKSFSDVEMLDLDVGRWIPIRSMREKRFALAAVELNGVIYATGGYDGIDYLKSAERLDPREHSWASMASMTTKRGCHSMVVFNEKIYALGGFDGNAMVPSVEIFDPRLGCWTTGETLKQAKGYFAAAVIKDSIYVIGGVKTGHLILDTVECYKEGQGWHESKAKVLGKRSFSAAIVMQ